MRILIQNIGTSEWVGGANYLKNLINSVREFDSATKFIAYGDFDQAYFGNQLKIDGQVQWVIDEDFKLKSYLRYEFELEQYHKQVKKLSPIKKFKAFFCGLDIFFKTPQEVYLQQEKLALQELSEKFDVSYLIEDDRITALRPNMYWIADFQHFAAPQFFSETEIAGRDKRFISKILNATLIIVSSESVKKDYIKFCDSHQLQAKEKVRVLNFAISFKNQQTSANSNSVIQKYNLPQKFFLLPNQFWIHKNHGVVIEALAIATRTNPEICVVMTGNPLDYRHPNHFQSLLQSIAVKGIHSQVRILGLIPAADLQMLMIKSHSLINPSLFEGWSTLVEEAKILGKRIILSDIEVHKEQSPPKAHFFESQSCLQLSKIMNEVWSIPAESEEQSMLNLENAEILSHEKGQEFARKFLSLAEEAIHLWQPKT